MFGLIFHLDLAGESVLVEDIVQNVFGSGGLTGCADGHACKVVDGLDLIAVFEYVEHAKGGNCKNNNILFKFVVQHGSEVDWNCRNIKFTVNELAAHGIGSRFDGYIVIFVFFAHELNDAHAGGALESRYADRRGVGLGAAQKQRRDEAKSKSKGNQFFHDTILIGNNYLMSDR